MIVLSLFLILGKSQPGCSYKVCSYKNKRECEELYRLFFSHCWFYRKLLFSRAENQGDLYVLRNSKNKLLSTEKSFTIASVIIEKVAFASEHNELNDSVIPLYYTCDRGLPINRDKEKKQKKTVSNPQLGSLPGQVFILAALFCKISQFSIKVALFFSPHMFVSVIKQCLNGKTKLLKVVYHGLRAWVRVSGIVFVPEIKFQRICELQSENRCLSKPSFVLLGLIIPAS